MNDLNIVLGQGLGIIKFGMSQNEILTLLGKADKEYNCRCIKDKKRALKKFPEFYQYTEDENFIEVTPNIYKARFTKRVRLKSDSEWKDYPSYLLIDISTSSILVKSDEVTDKNKK